MQTFNKWVFGNYDMLDKILAVTIVLSLLVLMHFWPEDKAEIAGTQATVLGILLGWNTKKKEEGSV